MLDPASQELLDLLKDVCFVVAADGTVRAVNRAATQVLRCAREELVGQPIRGFVPDDSFRRLEGYIELCLRSSEPLIGAIAIQPRSGGRLEFRVEGSRLRAADSSVPCALLRLKAKSDAANRFIALNQHIEALRAEVMRRRRLESRLEEKLAELSAADATKNTFLALLSHELRNPLAAIRGAAYLLKVLPEADRRDAQVRMIERHVAHLVRLLDDLLDVSRITNGKLRIEISTIPVAELVAVACESVRHLTANARQSVEVQVDEGLEVSGDFDRARQVLGNLLHNASKFSPPGGAISVSARREGDEGVITVADSGPGIPARLGPTLFSFFSQGQVEQTSKEGLGLGLALAKVLVEMQGGSLRLESPLGGPGAVFAVRLPLASKAGAAPPADPTKGPS